MGRDTTTRASPSFLTLAASVLGWLLSYAGLLPATVYARMPCATGEGSEMQLFGFAAALGLWTLAGVLLFLGRRALSVTGVAGSGHALALVPAGVWLWPALRHTTFGGIAVCDAFESVEVLVMWPATLGEKFYAPVVLVVIGAFATLAIRASLQLRRRSRPASAPA